MEVVAGEVAAEEGAAAAAAAATADAGVATEETAGVVAAAPEGVGDIALPLSSFPAEEEEGPSLEWAEEL